MDLLQHPGCCALSVLRFSRQMLRLRSLFRASRSQKRHGAERHRTPVQGGNPCMSGDADPPAICPPAEVDLSLSLLQESDKTERVVASSPNGAITGGLDIPVTPDPAVPKIPR
jgi:hypothetical protein